MNVKLSLTIDDSIIASAKQFASKHHMSLSKLVESYFKSIAREAAPAEQRLPGVVGELAGLLKDRDVDESGKAYAEHLEEKYR